MAPKSPAKRVTRARAAAKKEDVPSGTARKPAATKVSKPITTRNTKITKDEEPVEEMQVEEPPKKATGRTITKTTTLAAAPRRRIKVTPLNPPPVEDPAPEPKPTTKTKKTSTRSKKTAEEQKPAEEVALEPAPAPTKTSARPPKTTKAPKEKADSKEPVAPKTRGRPKKGAVAAEPNEAQIPEPAKPTRQTRTRAASSAEPAQQTEPAQPKAKSTKKVTFQDLPEDNKENLPVLAKKAAAKKEAPATGMRAKPVRKPSTAAKKTTGTTTRATRTKVEKPAARALTPKKITQVNRPATPEESNGEDELNGAKTPVRDLSVSPKRNTQVAATLSPAKKLQFTQSLAPNSPTKATESVLMSPARRPHASPEKDVEMNSPLKASPKRGDFAPHFPSASQNVTANTALVASTQLSLLQSPKRIQLDASAFSQSAMKPKQSPLKASLLQSPARRLFSPKKSTPSKVTKGSTKNALGTPEDIAISSHFRASVSPQRSGRVHRMSDEELADELANDMDFDQSVLNVRSPLKVMKEQPIIPVQGEHDEIDEDIAHAQEEKDNEVPAVVEEMVHDSEVVQAADPAEIAVVLPKNDKQAVIDEMVQDSAAINTAPPSEIEVALPAHVAEEVEDVGMEQDKENVPDAPVPAPSSTRRLSEVLFRSERAGEEESSEDELAGDKTPARAPKAFRSSLFGAQPRLSTGILPSVNQNIGFTPLATQMSGWLAASPEKKAAKKTSRSKGLFSPIAAQHVDGEVMISRQSTPQQKTPAARHSSAKRPSFAPRMSLAASQTSTPDKASFFEDQMFAHEADEEMDRVQHAQTADVDMHAEAEEIDHVLAAEEPEAAEADDALMSEDEGDTVLINQADGELTTDLIRFTNASDTAMVEFENLAKEAEELHDEEEEVDETYGDENTAPLEAMEVTEMVRHTTAQEHFAEYPMQSPVTAAERQPLATETDVKEAALIEATSSAPEAIQEVISEASVPVEPASSSPSPSPQVDLDFATPVQQDFSEPRFLNTVVSKVPLRPEGHVSPIKMPKKRARSLSNANQASPPKRAALTPIGKLAPRAASENIQSPTRQIRATAPSPAVTTPGQNSFAIDDFGDSTLDGIEMPEDETEIMDFEVGNPTLTPATVKSTKTVKSTAITPGRTPLKQLGEGPLSGAIVYVEVHTTEGADASGVYIDLLTEMGARCVKEWKWNPRASINTEDASASSKVGITHVVYKDGGKRTLEKVRDAKGEVWCVGVRWVLDSQRETKWLDETAYVVDHAILPRGGSRRRKSMEPSRLSNVNGTMSSKSGKRVSSAEFMTDAMKEDLINTPVRTFLANEGEDDTEISSTYNSPTTTMNIKHPGAYSTPTELKNWDPATSATPAPITPAPFNARRVEADGLKSAPPKQSNRGLFERSESGKENGDGDAKMKLKVKDARRQTMGWVPRVRSPLGKF